MKQLEGRKELIDMPIKEKARIAAGLFKDASTRNNVELKLRKKPK